MMLKSEEENRCYEQPNFGQLLFSKAKIFHATG